MIEKKELDNISKPYIIPVEMTKSDFDNLLNFYRMEKNKNNVVILLKGENLKSIDSLFNEFSAAFQFPSYFGKNWNALDECINDLDWLEGDNYIIGINDIQDLLINENEEELNTLFNILNNTCEEWSIEKDIEEEWGRPEKPFHFLMQYDKENLYNLKKRFSKYIDI